MSHKFRAVKALDRSGRPRRQPKPKIVIVCEGKVTEPQYFKDFKNLHGNSLVTIATIGGCGVPPSVVARAITEKQTLISEARKSRDSFESVFEVWAVFDRDAHPIEQVPQALTLAHQNGINVAYSNPCFEIWGLMHFSCYARPGHHHETQKSLKAVLDGYCHEKNPVLDVKALAPFYQSAVSNSVRAEAFRQAEGYPNGDPSTSVYKLTEQIVRFGKQ